MVMKLIQKIFCVDNSSLNDKILIPQIKINNMGRVEIRKNHTKFLINPGIFLTFLSKFSIVSILHFISRNRQVLKNNDQHQSKSSQVRENIKVYSWSVSRCLWRTSTCPVYLPMCWLLGQSSKTGNSPARCSPRTSSGSGALPGPGFGSSHHCIGFCSFQNQLS